MLPFLAPKKSPGVITVSTVDSNGSIDSAPEDAESSSLEICAEDMLRAIANKDAKALASALQAALDLHEPEKESE